jgi:hypothetical protein
MSCSVEHRRRRVRRLSREMLIAAVAVGSIALALSHPSVMSMAGLDISHQRAGAAAIDSIAVGSISADHDVHALTGILKGLRLGRD